MSNSSQIDGSYSVSTRRSRRKNSAKFSRRVSGISISVSGVAVVSGKAPVEAAELCATDSAVGSLISTLHSALFHAIRIYVIGVLV